MTLGVLIWTPTAIEVIARQRTYEHRHAIPADQRYWFGIDGRIPGRLYLRCPALVPPYRVSTDGGQSFAPAPSPPPEAGDISPFAWKLHPALPGLTALGSGVVWVLARDGVWQPRALATDLAVADVSFDPGGGLWCVGAAPSTRIPGEKTEAAARYQSVPGAPFAPASPHLGAGDSLRVIRGGGLAALRSVDAEGLPVVATSLCSWFVDDESSFAFLLGPGRSAVKRLPGETVRSIDRSASGRVRIFTCQASLWQVKDGAFHRRSLVPALQKALAVRDRALVVRGMDVEGSRWALAVEVAPAGKTVASDPDFTAVCISDDDGGSFEIAHRRTFRDGAEILDVSWLR